MLYGRRDPLTPRSLLRSSKPIVASRRSERVADLLQREISRVIGEDLKDPEVGFVTVTGVRVSDDLKHAKVLVSVLGDQERRERSLAALSRAKGYIRFLIGQRVRLRFTPEISFRTDKALTFIPGEEVDEEGA